MKRSILLIILVLFAGIREARCDLQTAMQINRRAWLEHYQGQNKKAYQSLLLAWQEWSRDEYLNTSMAELASKIYLNDMEGLFSTKDKESFYINFVYFQSEQAKMEYRFDIHFYTKKQHTIRYAAVVLPGGQTFEVYPKGQDGLGDYYDAENPEYKVLLNNSRHLKDQPKSGLYTLLIRYKDGGERRFPVFFKVDSSSIDMPSFRCDKAKSEFVWDIGHTILKNDHLKHWFYILFYKNGVRNHVGSYSEVDFQVTRSGRSRYSTENGMDRMTLTHTEILSSRPFGVGYSHVKEAICR